MSSSTPRSLCTPKLNAERTAPTQEVGYTLLWGRLAAALGQFSSYPRLWLRSFYVSRNKLHFASCGAESNTLQNQSNTASLVLVQNNSAAHLQQNALESSFEKPQGVPCAGCFLSSPSDLEASSGTAELHPPHPEGQVETSVV